MSVTIHGCRSNLAERDRLAQLAGPDTHVINSCAVTAAAVKDARSAARAGVRSGKQVVVTGCAATVDPDAFAGLPVRILPNSGKFDPRNWGKQAPEVTSAPATRQSRGFVAVQDGCDHSCTFCITRIARGAARSLPVAQVAAAVRRMVFEGASEVVLTGIDICSWQESDAHGRPIGLGHLVEAVLRDIPELPRLRLSSLDPAAVDDRLLAMFADPRVMPHAHLSLQSGDDLVLARMKRRHRSADAVGLVEQLRQVRPDIAIGCDLIAGFPTESDEAHVRSVMALDACDVVHAHVFPYSPRPGTPAARMPQVKAGVASARAAALRAHATGRHRAFLRRFAGQNVSVVSEGARGLSPHYAAVRFREPRARGIIVDVTVGGVEDGMLVE